MWCWQVKDVNVANTNEAGSLQRSIKSMSYKSCELLPTMIAAGMKWLQHSGHIPAQKFSTLHLLRPQVCQTAKFTAGRCPEQAMSISPHQQQIQRWDLHFKHVSFSTGTSSSFPVGCSDAINNAILWAVHPVSLSHQARWHPGPWLADGCQCWPLIGRCHPQPPPCHICHQHLYNYCSLLRLLWLLARPHIWVKTRSWQQPLAWQMSVSENVWTG